MSLPESTIELSALTVAEHEAHHVTVHDVLNKLLEDSDTVGDVLGRVGTGTGASATGRFQPHFTFDSQVKNHSHSVAGQLSFTVPRDTRVVKVAATADVTGIADVDMSALGAFGEIVVLVTASAAISFTAASAATVVVGSVPANLSAGQSVVFLLQKIA